MACCEGSCSCGKGSKSAVQENLALVQMSASLGMLSTNDWMKDMRSFTVKVEVVEVRFKNNRKAFYRNPQGIRLNKDDRVVLETEGGHDLGTISLSGNLAEKKYEQKHNSTPKSNLSQVYRKATAMDLDRWLDAKRRERKVLLESRSIARELGLQMSISDVEFRGDGKKVTISYTAVGRVNFRELIRKYAIAFGIRIEMKQIGVRQNAAKVKPANLTSSNSSEKGVQVIIN